MTREEARKAAEVMMAYANGKEIESTIFSEDKWSANPKPHFNWNLWDYRIKPEPTYRAFKDKEECWAEMQKHQPFAWLKGKKYDSYVLAKHIDNGIDFTRDFDEYTFIDGAPFGIKEE